MLSYDVFVNDPPPQDGVLPSGEPKRFSPMASTLISGERDAVLTDPGMTTDQANALGDWIAAHDRNLTDIFVTHGHGDHWFAASLLAQRFGARVVASAGTIAQMRANAATRPLLWDRIYTGIPDSPVTATTVLDNRFTLEGHELMIVEVGSTDSDDTTVLHVPGLDLVVAGDVIFNGVHMYLSRQIAQTRQYLDDAEELLRTEDSAIGFFNAKLERYPGYLGRTVLWAGARTLYGVREHPEQDVRRIMVGSWLSGPSTA